VSLLGHSALAFQLRYGWSQEAALLDTVRQTQAVTGLAFAGGLFINYAFLLLWLIETAWWCCCPARYRERARALDRSLRAFFMFMFVNGAIVFVHGPMRLVGGALVLAVAWAWYRRGGGGEEAAHA
jgi:hypothetical protein